MSEKSPPRAKKAKTTDSDEAAGPGSPRGRYLREKVSFFEQVWSNPSQSSSLEDLGDVAGRRRLSGDDFEESYERVWQEGTYEGEKIVQIDKITLRKSVTEVCLNEASSTPSDEHVLGDSAYQSHGVSSFQSSKSSSVGSFTRFPSEESLSRKSSCTKHGGALDDRSSSEWYAEYRNKSFQNVASRMEHVRSRGEYDAHIAEIKGSWKVLRGKSGPR